MAIGIFHQILVELKESLVETAREDAANSRKRFDNAREKQRAARQEREVIKMNKKLDNAKDQLFENIYLFEQYISRRCWETVDVVVTEYNKIPNKTQKLKAV